MKSIEELAKSLIGKQSDAIPRPKPDAISKSATTDSSGTDAPSDSDASAAEPTLSVGTPSATVGDPNCPFCHGMGYVRLDVPLEHPNFGKLFPCSCRIPELQVQRNETLRLLGNLNALERYTFERFNPDGHGLSPERQRNLHHAYQTARSFAQRPEGWLLLIGGYGCGKTHLAAAIANQVVEQGTVPLFVTVPDLLDHIRSAFAPTSSQPYHERFEEVRNTPLLILDDLGTENATPWTLEKLFQLLNYRYLARLATVITTNQELERIDPRIRSRLADPELVEIVTILAPDFRVGGAERVASELNTLPYYSDMTLDTFDLRRHELDPPQADNLARALSLARTYAADPEGWIVFTGSYGCGKTHLAAAIANERVRLGHPALLVVVPDLLDHLRAAFNPQSNASLDRRFEDVRRAPLLVLDDLGTESATPWAKEKLFQLLNFRYVARIPTVVTTATELTELDPKIAIRFSDVSRCVIFRIDAPPYLGGSGVMPSPPPTRGRRK